MYTLFLMSGTRGLETPWHMTYDICHMTYVYFDKFGPSPSPSFWMHDINIQNSNTANTCIFLIAQHKVLSDYYIWKVSLSVCLSVCLCVVPKIEPSDWSTLLSVPLCDWSKQLRMFRKLCWSLPQVVLSLVQDGATCLTLQWHCTLQRRQFSPQVDNVLPAFRQCSPRK